MQITKLIIGSNNLENQKQFYGDILGFKTEFAAHKELIISAGNTSFILDSKIHSPNSYHFAFLIPTDSLESAIQYINSKNIPLLPYKGDHIIHFDSGRSIYFFDPDGNIVEFIERPLLDYPSKKTFMIDDIICLNEIGHPVSKPLAVSQELIKEHGISPKEHKILHDNFCWIGDHQGAIIVVKEGRHWLPTDISGVKNDFDIEYQEKSKEHKLQIRDGKIEPQ